MGIFVTIFVMFFKCIESRPRYTRAVGGGGRADHPHRRSARRKAAAKVRNRPAREVATAGTAETAAAPEDSLRTRDSRNLSVGLWNDAIHSEAKFVKWLDLRMEYIFSEAKCYNKCPKEFFQPDTQWLTWFNSTPTGDEVPIFCDACAAWILLIIVPCQQWTRNIWWDIVWQFTIGLERLKAKLFLHDLKECR